MSDHLPDAPGTYALHLFLPKPVELDVGRLGRFHFRAGELIYLGSAFGPGGLHARLGRHLHGEGNFRWHIDYVKPATQVMGYWATLIPLHLECRWTQALISLPGAYVPARGLGASDCRNGCPAHIVAFSELDRRAIAERLEQAVLEIAPPGQSHPYPMISAQFSGWGMAHMR